VVVHVLAHTQGLGVPAIANDNEGVDFSIPKGGIQHTSNFGVLKVDVFFPRTELGVHPILVFSAWSLLYIDIHISGVFCTTLLRPSHTYLLLT